MANINEGNLFYFIQLKFGEENKMVTTIRATASKAGQEKRKRRNNNFSETGFKKMRIINGKLLGD